jgi:hypothetical protein
VIVLGLILTSAIFILGIAILILPKRYRRIFLLTTSLSLFIYKSVEYTLYGLYLDVTKIPLEFSTLTYFIFSITVLFNVKKWIPLASFMGFISGIGYLISFIFLSDQYFEHNGTSITLMAWINHSIIFIGGMILMKDYTFKKIAKKDILIFTSFYIFYVILMERLITFTQSFIFIRMLLGGDILRELFPQMTPTSYDYLLYFFLLFIIYQIAIYLFISINHLISHFNQGENHHEYTV